MPKLADKAFTDVMLRRLKPRPTRYDLFDAALRGLGLRVAPTGTKSWFVMRRISGRMKRVTLGRYPDLSLSDARLRAGPVLSSMADGSLPVPQDVPTFEMVFEDWMRRDQDGNRSSFGVRRALTVDALPSLGRKSIDTITRADILKILDGIVDRGAPIHANRVRAYLRRMFNWAVERGIIESSPVNGIPAQAKENDRDRVLTLEELRTVWAAATKMGYPFGPMFQLLILTGQRRQEVAGAEWPEFDFKECNWTLPAAKAKNAKMHFVHLSPTAVDILTSMPRIDDSPFLFTTTGANPVSGFSKAKHRIDTLSGVTDWTIHDIRRSFATHTTETLAINPVVIDKILNHVNGVVRGVAAVYQRGQYLDQRKAAMSAWDDLLHKR